MPRLPSRTGGRGCTALVCRTIFAASPVRYPKGCARVAPSPPVSAQIGMGPYAFTPTLTLLLCRMAASRSNVWVLGLALGTNRINVSWVSLYSVFRADSRCKTRAGTVEEARPDCNHANPLERTVHLDAVTPCPSPVLILECNLRVRNETLSSLSWGQLLIGQGLRSL